MNSRTRSGKLLHKTFLVLALMATSLLAWGQHNEDKKPQEHESKPSRQSSPPSRPSGSSHQSQPRNPSAGRPSENRGTPPAARPANPPNRGENQGNRELNRPGNAPNRNVTQPGNRPSTPGHRENAPNRGNPPNRGVNPENRGNMRPGTPINRGNPPNRGATNRPAIRPAPGRTVTLRGGGTARIAPNGQVRTIHRNDMVIRNNPRVGRTIITERNNVRIVNVGRNRGYVQRPYIVRGGRSYYSRTYYDRGVVRVSVYRGYYYHGYRYYGYYPPYWYHPAFYGWAYRPWGPPIVWGIGIGGWGWVGTPWWGYYGGWFTPYPTYPSAAFWLTDFVIAANLQAAYSAQSQYADDMAGDAQASANYTNGGQASSEPVTLTPEVKQAIAEEVKAQLEQQQQQAQQGDSGQAQNAAPSDENQVPPALDPARRTFIVSTPLTVDSNDGECTLTPGDVITRLTDTPDENQNVNASVSASKKNDCAAGAQISISVDALQDMHNHFQEQLNNGMKTLSEKQGTGNLPKAPDTATTPSAVQAPPADQDAQKELTDQEQQADQTEKQVEQEAQQPNDSDQQQQ